MPKIKKVKPYKKEYLYEGVLLEWLDGDTCRVRIDLGFNKLSAELVVRLNGVNCPEKNTTLGQKALDSVNIWCPSDQSVSMRTHKPNPEDKYGRWLADVTSQEYTDGVTIAQQLIAAGLGKPWNGRGPKPTFTEEI